MSKLARRYQPLILGALGIFLTACPSDNGPGGAPVINSFSANPATVLAAGQAVQLSWSVSGSPTSLEISGVGPVSGSNVTVTPTATTTYTLTATNSSGSDTELTTVTVGGTPPPPPPGGSATVSFGVSASQTGPFESDAGGNITGSTDPRVLNVDAGDTFYAQVSYSGPAPVSGITIYLANSSPAGFRSDLVSGTAVNGFTLGDELTGCAVDGTVASVTCVYPITVSPGTPNISSLTPDEFAYVLRTRIADTAGTLYDEPPRGYVVVGSGGGTTGGSTTGGSTTGGSTTGGTTGGSTTGGTSTGGSTTGGTTGSNPAEFSVSVADVAPVTLEGNGTAAASLDGTASIIPDTGTTTYGWTAEGAGGGNVTFAAPSALDTGVTFSAAGLYTLRLTATNTVELPDDVTQVSDTVQVSVSPAGPNDTTRPSVTVSQAAGQDDPTDENPITFTVTFSEPVTGFNRGDVELGGAGAANTDDGNIRIFGARAYPVADYRVEVDGLTASGPVTAAVSSNAAADAAGNRNTRSTGDDNTVTYQP